MSTPKIIVYDYSVLPKIKPMGQWTTCMTKSGPPIRAVQEQYRQYIKDLKRKNQREIL